MCASQRALKLSGQSRAMYQNRVFGQRRYATATATHPSKAPFNEARMHLGHRPTFAESRLTNPLKAAFTGVTPGNIYDAKIKRTGHFILKAKMSYSGSTPFSNHTLQEYVLS